MQLAVTTAAARPTPPPAPTTVADAIAKGDGALVDIVGTMVYTSHQREGGGVPYNEVRLSNDVYATRRNPHAPLAIESDSPSILIGKFSPKIDALIAAARLAGGHNSNWNAAEIRASGVLHAGTELHDHSMSVDKIDLAFVPAPPPVGRRR